MKREVALVLSSGSSRGLAHIGAIEALEQRGYHIHSVAGCSIGAIVGGMYAAGKMPELKQWFLDMDRKRMLSLTDFSVRMDHLVKGDRLMEAFASMGADTVIENLPKSLALIATDVNSGQEKVFTSGPLSLLIRASFSLPGPNPITGIPNIPIIETPFVENVHLSTTGSLLKRPL